MGMRKAFIAVVVTNLLLFSCYCFAHQGRIDICSQTSIQLFESIEIRSPKYPESFGTNYFCKMSISSPWRRIKVEYIDYQLSGSSDEYLSIAGSRQYGDKKGGSEEFDLGTYDRKILSLEFQASSYRNSYNKGFLIRLSGVHRVAVPVEVYAQGTQTASLPVNLKSPGYPNTYSNNQAGLITITSTEKSTKIKVKFVKFELEDGESGICKQDVLQIHNSRFCGNHTGEVIELNIPDYQFSVMFSSDGTIKRFGFYVEISYAPNFCNQNFMVFQLPFHIKSLGYPDIYPNNISCGVHALPSLMPRVLLRFLSFDLEADEKSNCKFDVLRIGSKSFCGNHTGETVELDVLEMSALPLVFKTDDSEQRKGFNIEISFPTAHDICETKEITLPAYIKTPDYPQQYSNRSRCETLLRLTEGVGFNFEFLEFELENDADFFYINETRYSGSLSRKVINQGNLSDPLLLRFTSDKTISLKGFFIKISAMRPDN